MNPVVSALLVGLTCFSLAVVAGCNNVPTRGKVAQVPSQSAARE